MIWQDLLINFVDKHEVVYVYMVNIRVNVDKTLDKDLFHIIKNARSKFYFILLLSLINHLTFTDIVLTTWPNYNNPSNVAPQLTIISLGYICLLLNKLISQSAIETTILSSNIFVPVWAVPVSEHPLGNNSWHFLKLFFRNIKILTEGDPLWTQN